MQGDDYVSKTISTHTDSFGHFISSEEVSNTYVIPYTPQAPTVDNPAPTTVDVTINPHASEAAGLEYAIQEVNSGDWVLQSTGALQGTPDYAVPGTGVDLWNISAGL